MNCFSEASKVVTSISSNLIMPIVSYLLEFTGNNWREMTVTPVNGLTFEIGQFSAAFVDFLLISIILFYLYTNAKKIFDDKKPPHKITCCELIRCRYCQADINYQAVRCPNCTSWLKGKNNELLVKKESP